MQVNYSGWNIADGAFSFDIYVDENKKDYEIQFENGVIARQRSFFSFVTADWNNDGDWYTQYGAWFDFSDGCASEFLTPDDLVRMAADAIYEEYSSCGPRAVSVSGIDIPDRRQRQPLDEMITDAEREGKGQDRRNPSQDLTR